MKRLTTGLMALLAALGLQAQGLRGVVVDRAGQPIDYATVVMQQAEDSVYVDATTTDSLGRFSFRHAVTPYRLIVQHLTYEPQIVVGHDTDSELRISMNENAAMIGEVVVQATRPQVRVTDNGALAYDASALSENRPVNTALDYLDQIPLI